MFCQWGNEHAVVVVMRTLEFEGFPVPELCMTTASMTTTSNWATE